jgi:hypothetical protein
VPGGSSVHRRKPLVVPEGPHETCGVRRAPSHVAMVGAALVAHRCEPRCVELQHLQEARLVETEPASLVVCAVRRDDRGLPVVGTHDATGLRMLQERQSEWLA